MPDPTPVSGRSPASPPVLAAGRCAVVTGAAGGIGLAVCKRLAGLGMKVVLADIAGEALDDAADAVAQAAPGGGDDVLALPTDVADSDAVAALADAAFARFVDVALVMNNAVVRDPVGTWQAAARWRHQMEVNFWGVVNGTQAFVPRLIEQGTPAAVVNTGSKQGITNPPKNPPYNVAKAALKAYTELLAHELRNTDGCRVTAHLLIPGWTTRPGQPHQPGAWLPDQVAGALIDGLGRGDFYILCPDGETMPEMDRRRILWAAGDIVDNRPALSRWHADFAGAFDDFEP